LVGDQASDRQIEIPTDRSISKLIDRSQGRNRAPRFPTPAGLPGGSILVEYPVPYWYHWAMDINVKSIPSEVARRLTEQAEAENMSQQEWIRQVLARAAGRLSPAELLKQRQAVSPMSEAEFEKAMATVTTHRQASAKHLRASQRRS
jgi:hypothetical protein